MRKSTNWTPSPAYLDCTVELTYDFDQPREMVPGATSVFDERWVGGADPLRFFGLFSGRSGYRSEDQAKPLASVTQVTAHASQGGPIIATWQGVDLDATGGAASGFQHDGRGSYVGTSERLRVSFGKRGAEALQKRPDGVLIFVGRDAHDAIVFVVEKTEHYQFITPPR